jgi:2-polyprenyl-3-methyl-5-hydroxy-6-metoxy-1,4-benzoquinol methylase
MINNGPGDPGGVFCKVCGRETAFVAKNKRRPFYRCMACELISVPPKYWLSVDDEKARYDLHDNTVSNGGYVKFLSEAADVVDAAIKVRHHPQTKVLDFGCGRDAVLCRLLWERGVDCYGYDPLYGDGVMPAPQAQGIGDVGESEQFDIIILCEVIEHLRDIMGELKRVCGMLRGGGVIIVRTRLYGDPDDFPDWWYAQDLTHINFFNSESISVIAGMVGKEVVLTGYEDIFVLKSKDKR